MQTLDAETTPGTSQARKMTASRAFSTTGTVLAVGALLLIAFATPSVAFPPTHRSVNSQECSAANRKSSSMLCEAAPASGVDGGVAQSEKQKGSSGTTTQEDDPDGSNYRFKHSYITENKRPDFEILNRKIGEKQVPLIYLDSAATSQKPRQVVDKITHYYNYMNSNAHRSSHTLSREATEAYEGARDQIADFINAYSREEVVFTTGATQAINLVASSYGQLLESGDEILLTEAEHHANIVPWHLLAEKKDVKIKYVPLNRETQSIDWDKLPELLTDKTKVVAFQQVSNVLGNHNHVGEITKVIRKHSPDAKILVDACQSIPHMPVDVQQMGVDFLAASGHKALGPTGIGFLWGRKDLLNSMPPFQGGGEMIKEVTMETSTYAQSPDRFEAGTPPLAQAIGLGEALKYLDEIGMEKIFEHEHEMGRYLYDRLSEIPGVRVLGPPPPHRVGIAAFVHESIHPSDLDALLNLEGVAIRAGHHCCQPLHRAFGISHSARASCYIYTTKEEIDSFIEKLKKTIAFFDGLGPDSDDTKSDGDLDFVPFL